MAYNPNIQTTNWYVENQMFVEQNYGWDKNGDNGKGDAIARTAIGFFNYGDLNLIEGIKKCWIKINKCDPDYEQCDGKEDDYYYRGQRFNSPEYFQKDMSRDHTIMTAVALHLANDPFLKELSNHIRYKIREGQRHKFTPTMWCWFKIFAKKWWASIGFYICLFFELLVYNIINYIGYKNAPFSEEIHPDEWKNIPKEILTDKQKWWRDSNLMFPAFGLNLLAWQLYVLKDNIFKRLMQFLAKPLIPRYNYYFMLLLNVNKKVVTKEKVLNYKPMKGGRWTATLNELNDRDVFIIKNEEYLEANTLDTDVLKKLWNLRHPEDKINY